MLASRLAAVNVGARGGSTMGRPLTRRSLGRTRPIADADTREIGKAAGTLLPLTNPKLRRVRVLMGGLSSGNGVATREGVDTRNG